MTLGDATVPASPAASANGTVKPSDMPITMSRTVAVAVKCVSRCRVTGMLDPPPPRRVGNHISPRVSTRGERFASGRYWWTRMNMDPLLPAGRDGGPLSTRRGARAEERLDLLNTRFGVVVADVDQG